MISTNEHIENLENELIKAMRSSDTTALDTLIHEDLIWNVPGGQTFTKAMDQESYRSGDMTVEEISSKDRTIQIIGDNAVVVQTIKMKGAYKGYAFDDSYRFLRIWKQFSNEWKVIAGSSNPIY